ncbi:hypothetical protein Avbf_08596 [Armadillidium vulgare]|nr:hypothetical protein Avbf_08596 [Armadillidium vulgare]
MEDLKENGHMPPLGEIPTKEINLKESSAPGLDRKSQFSQHQTLSEIWKNCVRKRFVPALPDLDAEWTRHWEEFDQREDEELRGLECVLQESEELNKGCNQQIQGLHSSLLTLASSFRG